MSLVPFKPKRPCSHTGCPELTEKRFCPEHARYRKYQRDPKINRRYDHRWRKIRAATSKPTRCARTAWPVAGTRPWLEVHHVIPLDHGGTHDESNLCAACASRATRASPRSMATVGGKPLESTATTNSLCRRLSLPTC